MIAVSMYACLGSLSTSASKPVVGLSEPSSYLFGILGYTYAVISAYAPKCCRLAEPTMNQ